MTALNPSPGWTEERTDRLKVLWDEGLSASQAAKELGGITRNAVIGKVNRMGWSRDESALLETRKLSRVSRRIKPIRPKRVKARKSTVNVHPGNIVRAAAARRHDPGLGGYVPPAIDHSHSKPWTERKFGECAFPIGEGADLLSCCAPTERTYCAGCEAVMFRPEQPTQKSTMRMARLAA